MDCWNLVNLTKYSACIKVKSGEYKNFWLVPITRTSFLFIAYVPQLEFLNELAKIQVVQNILPKFSFLSSIYNMQDSSEGYKIDEDTRIGSSAIILKVEESLDDFIFPWRGCIDNEEIISSYAKLNAIYSRIVSQIEKLYKIAEEVNNRQIEAIEAKQKQILKKTLIKTGVKLVALSVAPYAVAAIDGVDLLVDGIDVFDMDMSDFGFANFDDNLLDLGDTNFDSISDFDTDNSYYSSDLEVSADSQYNVSFEGQKATLDRKGGGLGSVKVTITKEAGTSNEFIVSDGTHTAQEQGGDQFVELNGIDYKLPKLKG